MFLRRGERRFSRSSSALLLLCLSVFHLRCGSVGEPQSPLLNIPQPAADLQAAQGAEGIVLEWTWPRVTTEGMPLTNVTGFDVYAMALAADSPAPEQSLFQREGRLVASLSGVDLASHGPGDRLRLTLDPRSWVGRRIAFAVRGETRRRQSDLSNIALVEVTTPPGRPTLGDLRVDAEAIELKWSASQGADRYAVERRAAEGDFTEIGVTDGLNFRDAGYRFGVAYSYRVQGIIETSTGAVRGEFSEPVTITPVDTFPPARPLGLRAVVTESAVQLSWEGGQESDLAGYRIRRRLGTETVVLNAGPSPAAAYSDHNVQRGARYVYEVVAVDQEGNESPPSEPVEVAIP
jgi:hypothetical protein